MTKRIKSFLITAASVLGTAFIALTVTPQWVDFLSFASDKLGSWGIPSAVLTLIGIFISEVWKQILNNHTLRNTEGRLGANTAKELY